MSTMSQVKISNKKTPIKQKITGSLHAETSPMIKGVNEASMQYNGTYTKSKNITMNYSMAMFSAPVYLNKNKGLIIANGYVNHNY